MNLEDKLLKIVDDLDDDGEMVNELADEFRVGRSVAELLPVLNSDNEDVVSVGLWIVSEIVVPEDELIEVSSRLIDLLSHSSASIRFSALGALYPVFLKGDSKTKSILEGLKKDPNLGVRERADLAWSRIYED